MFTLLNFNVSSRSLPTLYAVEGAPGSTVQVTVIFETAIDDEVFTNRYFYRGRFFSSVVWRDGIVLLNRRWSVASECIIGRLSLIVCDWRWSVASECIIISLPLIAHKNIGIRAALDQSDTLSTLKGIVFRAAGWKFNLGFNWCGRRGEVRSWVIAHNWIRQERTRANRSYRAGYYLERLCWLVPLIIRTLFSSSSRIFTFNQGNRFYGVEIYGCSVWSGYGSGSFDGRQIDFSVYHHFTDINGIAIRVRNLPFLGKLLSRDVSEFYGVTAWSSEHEIISVACRVDESIVTRTALEHVVTRAAVENGVA